MIVSTVGVQLRENAGVTDIKSCVGLQVFIHHCANERFRLMRRSGV
jgi:hypothetical protein